MNKGSNSSASEVGSDDETNDLDDNSGHELPDFLRVKHPFELAGIVKKELSPVLKAITKCIMDHNGSASEVDIFKYINEKWEIISSHSPRLLQGSPTKRLIRLNLSTKKADAKLYLRDPNIKGNYILGRVSEDHVIDTDDGVKSETNDSKTDQDTKEKDSCNIEPIKFSIEDDILSYISDFKDGTMFHEILNHYKKNEFKSNLFGKLSLERQIRAILIVLKSKGLLYHYPEQNIWSRNKIQVPGRTSQSSNSLSNNILSGAQKDIKNMCIDELWSYLTRKNIY